MSVRSLALQLYYWMQRVEGLEKAMAKTAPENIEERRGLEEELIQARRQVEHYHKLLEAQKEEPLI